MPARRLGHPVWASRLLGARRVADWLALLDFAVVDVRYRVHGPPVDHAATLVNGQVVAEHGVHTGARPGRVLREFARG